MLAARQENKTTYKHPNNKLLLSVKLKIFRFQVQDCGMCTYVYVSICVVVVQCCMWLLYVDALFLPRLMSLKSEIFYNFRRFCQFLLVFLTFEPKIVEKFTKPRFQKYLGQLHCNFEPHFGHFDSNLRLNSKIRLLIKK